MDFPLYGNIFKIYVGGFIGLIIIIVIDYLWDKF